MKKICSRCGLVRVSKKGFYNCDPCRRQKDERDRIVTAICDNCGIAFSRQMRNFRSKSSFCSLACYQSQISGENNPGWKGGIKSLKQRIHHSEKMSEWRYEIFKRNDFKCFYCGKRGSLEAHHIIPIAKIFDAYRFYFGTLDYEGLLEYPPLWNLNNGVALCESCHRQFPTRTKVDEVVIPAELAEIVKQDAHVIVALKGLESVVEYFEMVIRGGGE